MTTASGARQVYLAVAARELIHLWLLPLGQPKYSFKLIASMPAHSSWISSLLWVSPRGMRSDRVIVSAPTSANSNTSHALISGGVDGCIRQWVVQQEPAGLQL